MIHKMISVTLLAMAGFGVWGASAGALTPPAVDDTSQTEEAPAVDTEARRSESLDENDTPELDPELNDEVSPGKVSLNDILDRIRQDSDADRERLTPIKK